MCGIAGSVGKSLDEEVQQVMLETMRRRGPDGYGVYNCDVCTILHTRLSIIDPHGGAQPMIYQEGNRKYVITYNGELYNTDAVRKELLFFGHHFMGYSDTEVVLHAYVQWGKQAVNHLNGIFAFAVWSEQDRKLFMARDRMGVKPLFYKVENGVLLFSSELKTILSVPGVRAQIDDEGVAELVLLGPGRTPGCAVFKDILELEPGCIAEFQCGKLSISRYWRLIDRPHLDSFEETVEKVRYLVMDSICSQTVSDVPIGTFLSGGLDSSIISAIVASRQADPLKTFSVDYLDNDKYFTPDRFQPNSDNEYIRIMCAHIGCENYRTVLSSADLIRVLEASTDARDLPGMADVDFSLHAFCGEISKHVKVALSGECADEIFGGYPWYRDKSIRDQNGFPWAQNTEFRESLLCRCWKRTGDYVNDKYLDTLRSCDILSDSSPDERRMKEMVNLNVRWFMQTLLERKDRMSMYHSLEVRVPFCDYRIAEYLYSVPWAMKDHGGKEKGLLRTSMSGILPHAVLWRKKSPYPKTHHPEYEMLVTEQLRELIKQKDAPVFSLIDIKRVASIIDSNDSWPWYGQLMRRPQIIAYLLQLNYWMKKYKVSVL